MASVSGQPPKNSSTQPSANGQKAPPNSTSTSRTRKRKLEKKVRAWLQVVAVLIIPLVIAWLGYSQNQTSLQLSDKQHASDQSIAQKNRDNDNLNAKNQQQDTTLKGYLDDMTTLLLQDHLRQSHLNDEVRQIARAKTLNVLPQLDGQRKGAVIRFLYETGLIHVSATGPIVILYNADLTNVNLHGGELQGVDLVRATLTGANFSDANLSDANLSYANMNEANLQSTNLRDSALGLARIVHADMRKADLTGAYWSPYNTQHVLITTQLLEQQSPLLSGATMPDGSKHP